MGKPKIRRRTCFNPRSGRYSKKYFAKKRKLKKNLKHYASVQTPAYCVVERESDTKFKLKKIVPKIYGKLSLTDTGKMSFMDDSKYNDGYRLFNLDLLRNHILEISMHSATCQPALNLACNGQAPVKLLSEKKRFGIASVIHAQCIGCNKIFVLNTSEKISTSSPHQRFVINVRAVWGTVASGGGVSNLNEILGTMGAYGMSQPTFTAIEQEISEWWRQVLQEEMLAAGQEELRLALKRGDFHEGVPAITVVIDGGWSKRSHKHSYNALGGVAIIVGHETKKLLYIGVRNKSCYICTLAETKHTVAADHKCYQNWNESSAAMESDIILQGFNDAEKVHGLRYMRIVADGDSSVYPTIQEKGPIWGKHVTKLECANHVCKCLRSNLEKLVEENPTYKGKGRLTKNVRKRITTAVRCAIKMRSVESDKNAAANKLERDIRNSVFHVFGKHDKCSADFCKSKNVSVSEVNVRVELETDSKEEISDDVLDNQASIWGEVTDESNYAEGRKGYFTSYQDIDESLLKDISILLDRTARKSTRLIENFTTNICESWMHIRAKFDGGKMFNRCSRGSWNARCYGSALRQNFGTAWSPTVWSKCTDSQPSEPFYDVYRKRSFKHYGNVRFQTNPEVRKRAVKRKMERERVACSKKAKREYGEEVLDQVPDVPTVELEKECTNFYNKIVKVSDSKIKEIEKLTVEQTNSSVWLSERRRRLTSSCFGEVVKRNANKPVEPLVRKLLYSKFLGNKFTAKGLREERNTIHEYVLEKAKVNENISVFPYGLNIDSKYNHLAASPDGVVISSCGEKGLVEVKYLLQNNKYSIKEACCKVKSFCLEIFKDKIHLKRNHNYFFQCQGQLNVCNLPWVDFVVRRTDPHDIFIERIYRDEMLWGNMVEKLNSFYSKALLPELSMPRNGKYPGIREPGIWFEKKFLTTYVSGTCKRPQRSQSPRPSTSKAPSGLQKKIEQTSVTKTCRRPPRRASRQKFEGRRISHKWIHNNIEKWYKGVVLCVISGDDGIHGAEYEVLYDGEKTPHIVDNLHEDFADGSLKFIDVD